MGLVVVDWAMNLMPFDRWLDMLTELAKRDDPDFDRPSPEFKAEYEEYRRQWERGLTTAQAWAEVMDDLPDE